jgi:tetratricopeptide (TPR) repeat protein
MRLGTLRKLAPWLLGATCGAALHAGLGLRASDLASPSVPSPSADSSDSPDGGEGRRLGLGPPSDSRVHAPGQPLKRCFSEDASGAPPRPLDSLLDRAATLFDAADFAASLVCAEEAARVDPRSVEAHHDRGAALEELGRWSEAIDAFSRALAIDPDDPETLAAAAELYVNRLPPTGPQAAEHSEIGLELARRGSERIARLGGSKGPLSDGGTGELHKLLGARLALLEGQALNDLGRSRDALARLDTALLLAPQERAVRYERAVALFDLCRFPEAQRALGELVAERPEDAWAQYHLALAHEQVGELAAAERAFAAARTLAPKDFPPPVELGATEFKQLVDEEVRRLPPALQGDLAQVHLEVTDLPDVRDLTADEPPLAPTILGLFRGAPLGEPSVEPRTIILYRKNLARAVGSRVELVTQIRTTLHHELGHLRGEDDEALRARGLE